MRPLLRALLGTLSILVALIARATHNEAGEIIVCHQSGLTYQVTIITHTNPNSPADRPQFTLDWGDGVEDTIPRTDLSTFTVAGELVQRNLYIASHTYPGPGVYTLQYIDPNRVAGVVNIPNSVNVPMCVQSQIIVLPNDFSDCLPSFLNIPIQKACLGQPWVHNPAAYDLDGDSLSYELVVCLGADLNEDGTGDPIPGYQFPDQIFPGPNNHFAMDPVTGTITWDSPQLAGIYNIAFRVIEWRNGVQIGWVERDMQVIVAPDCNDHPPVLGAMIDTCITAGTTLTFGVSATDPDPGQLISLYAFGGPFQVSNSPATFTSSPHTGTVTGTFNWNTDCSHVRQQAYQVVFNARDDYQVPLQDYQSSYITVVAPAPLNPSATPDGSIMHLHWDADVCSNALGYRIYRRQQLYGFDPGPCETGVPGYTGYSYIGSTTGWSNTSYDDHDLAFGITYCYMVVAYFADGALSYASDEFCNMLERDVPIMTHVSVGITDVATGVDTVRWSNAYDLDVTQYPGPYLFKLYAGDGLTQAGTLVHTTAPFPTIADPDTMFVHTGIDTRTIGHAYRVELYYHGGDSLVGSGNVASSIFLVPEPNDEMITLHMTHNTPWINDHYDVYRDDGGGGGFVLIGTASTETYVDTALVNGHTYCYYAIGFGAYSDPNIVNPLINYSQQVCAVPVDLTPPCPPTLALDNDCETPLNTLTWNNPNESCAHDTWRYHIWFTDSIGGELQLIATIVGAENTTFQHTDGTSVAGCYAISAIDSVGNESALSDTICGDNCPIYTLPNVFTPNHDNVNDLFIPFPYRGVKEIDLRIFNRWGQLVFESSDPAIEWPGTRKGTNEPVPDGVYFYTCGVTMLRLSGPQYVQLKGYVHILRGSQGQLN